MGSFNAGQPATQTDRAMRRIRSGLVLAALPLLAAACTSGIGAVNGATSPESPTTQQRIGFQLEEHGYTLNPRTRYGTPTLQQRMEFVLEEHGYSLPVGTVATKTTASQAEPS